MRVDEWDARGPEVTNPVSLGPGALEVASRLIFELVQPQGAEVVGTYQADFYAGTAAVTRHRFGAGLDQAGVSWVIGRVLAEQGLAGRHPGEVETAARVAPDGTRLLFLLNHRAEPVTVPATVDGVDLLTGACLRSGQPVTLGPRGVVVLREGT